jgi:hypothetical protein
VKIEKILYFVRVFFIFHTVKSVPYFRKVVFDLFVEKKTFLHGLETLEKAISSFFHISLVGNL